MGDSRAPALWWRVERALVDRARGAVAAVQPLPPLAPLDDPALDHWPAVRQRLDVRQPDQNTCGSSCLVVLRLLRDPTYADRVLDAPDRHRAFGDAATAVMARTNHLLDTAGRVQLPWPQRGGTRPAALVRMLASPAYGDPRLRYRNAVIDPEDPEPVWHAVRAQVRAGEPVPLYLGDHRWMQHIVLAVEAGRESVTIWNPAPGHAQRLRREEFLADHLTSTHWPRPWLAILASRRD